MEKLIKFLDDEFNRFDVDHSARMKMQVDLHRIFRGKLDKKYTNSKKSRLVINKTKVSVMHGVANIVDILFADTNFFDVVGRTPYDQKGASVIKKTTQWLVEIGDYIEEATKYILQAAIYGTTFGKITKRSVVDVSVDHMPIMNVIRKVLGFRKHYTTKTVSYPVFEMVDIMDMWVDPTGTALEPDRCSGLFQRIRRPMEYMKGKQSQHIYENVDELEVQVLESDKRRKNVNLPNVSGGGQEVEFYEYWGRVPAEAAREAQIEVGEGQTEVQCIITWSRDKKIVLRKEVNAFPAQQWMFTKDVWELSGDKDMFGRGIVENVRGPQMALNNTVNTRLDNKAWAIAAPLVVNLDGVEYPEEDLIARPNWIIRGRGKPDDVAKFIQMPDVTSSALTEAREFERIISDESGISRTVEASQSFGSNRTAQGISIAFAAAARPIRLIARGFERNLISKGLKKMYTLFLVDLDETVLIRLMDDPRAPQFVKVDPVSLSLDIDFMPRGTFALASREAMAQNIVAFAQAVTQVPQAVNNINWSFLIQRFYEALFGSADWDKVWLGGGANAAQAGSTQESGGLPGGAGEPGVAGTTSGTDALGILGAIGGIPPAGTGGGEE